LARSLHTFRFSVDRLSVLLRLGELMEDAPYQARSLQRQGRIELHGVRAGCKFGAHIVRAGDSANPDQGQAAFQMV
jgi:hypothetical protein